MNNQHFWPRLAMFFSGICLMGFAIALSCKADLGTTPISSLPWVLSLCTPYSVGVTTIAINLLIVAAQPLLLRKFYWRELLGQAFITLPFGYSIDVFMYLLGWYNPVTPLEKWAGCLVSIVVIAFGIFLEVRAKIFLTAGEGFVNVMAFVTRKNFSLLKNCFDITLVAISIIISIFEIGELRGVGLGTIAAAVLVGRMVYVYERYVHFFDKWKVKS